MRTDKDSVFCPLIDDLINPIDCMENRDIREESIPEKYKVKKDWREICKKCPYYEY